MRLQVGDVGVAAQKPEQFVDDRAQMQPLGGQQRKALGQVEAARESLLEARDIATATGSRATLWPILAALSALEPDPTAAQQLHRQAQEIVESIASFISAADLRASFLNLPQVQALVST